MQRNQEEQNQEIAKLKQDVTALKKEQDSNTSLSITPKPTSSYPKYAIDVFKIMEMNNIQCETFSYQESDGLLTLEVNPELLTYCKNENDFGDLMISKLAPHLQNGFINLIDTRERKYLVVDESDPDLVFGLKPDFTAINPLL